MNTVNGQTTLVCLFHSPDQADDTVNELVSAGIPKSSIGVMGNAGTAAANSVAMEKWKVPQDDVQFLTEGINKGGVVVAVSAADRMADQIDQIFSHNRASQIDESVARVATVNNSTAGQTIDVVEEQMSVGKREVQRGGVRVYQRVTEVPVSETVTLREERVTVERHAVNRTVQQNDTSAFQDRSIELTAAGEEAVVSKTARVIEEVSLGKSTTQHTETVKGTVRKTDVTVENVDPNTEKVATASVAGNRTSRGNENG